MKRACLAIGVGDAPPLDYLEGAVNGARAIADWARAPGPDGKPRFETILLTDELDPVGIAEVKAALEGLLAGGADSLLLYFAGHGLSRDAGESFWLPSDWDSERLAISVAGLRDKLFGQGVLRLVMVADACRSMLDARTRDLVGVPVLGKARFEVRRPKWELWQAASEARAAWMIPAWKGIPARCVFSGLLVEALNGAHAGAFEDGDRTKPLTSESLSEIQVAEVPKVAQRYGADLLPEPVGSISRAELLSLERGPEPPPAPLPWPEPEEARVTGMGAVAGERIRPPPGRSWSTKDAAAPPAQAPETAQKRRGALGRMIGDLLGGFGMKTASRDPDVTLSGGGGPDLGEVLGGMLGQRRAPEGPSLAAVAAADMAAGRERKAAMAAEIGRETGRLAGEARPGHFESGAGFTVAGAGVAEAWLGTPAVAVPLGESGYWRVEPGDPEWAAVWWNGRRGVPFSEPLPLLVRLSDGRYLGAAALPRFVLSFTVGSDGADAVIYRSYDVPHAPETERVMAELRVAGLGVGQTAEVVSRLRGAKHADPMLGVLAAYLHDAMGDWANVARAAWFFAERGEPVPFDIAMLGRFPCRREPGGLVRVIIPATEADDGARGLPSWMRMATPEGEGVVAGAFPWMRQGWARLDPDGVEGLYPAGLSAIGRALLPAPFTSLTAAGGDTLRHLLWGEG
jgi:hypothetical protein